MLGYGIVGGVVELGLGLGIAGVVYMRLVLAMRVPEAVQVQAMFARRLGPVWRRIAVVRAGR